MAFASLSDLVKNFESGGNYTAVNPTSSASGAYQFTNPTWAQYAGQIGVDTSQYPTAASAPPAVQDAVFNQAVSQRGLGDWTCPGCNAPLTQYVASNDVSQLPVSSTYNGASTIPAGDTTGQGYGSNGVVIDPTTGEPIGGGSQIGTGVGGASGTGGYSSTGAALIPGVGYPTDVGLQPGAQAAIAAIGPDIGNSIASVGTTLRNATMGWLDSLQNWVGRGFLILIALVILLVALWRIMDPDGEKTKAVVADAAVV
jgi:hypothetical protein